MIRRLRRFKLFQWKSAKTIKPQSRSVEHVFWWKPDEHSVVVLSLPPPPTPPPISTVTTQSTEQPSIPLGDKINRLAVKSLITLIKIKSATFLQPGRHQPDTGGHRPLPAVWKSSVQLWICFRFDATITVVIRRSFVEYKWAKEIWNSGNGSGTTTWEKGRWDSTSPHSGPSGSSGSSFWEELLIWHIYTKAFWNVSGSSWWCVSDIDCWEKFVVTRLDFTHWFFCFLRTERWDWAGPTHGPRRTTRHAANLKGRTDTSAFWLYQMYPTLPRYLDCTKSTEPTLLLHFLDFHILSGSEEADLSL